MTMHDDDLTEIARRAHHKDKATRTLSVISCDCGRMVARSFVWTTGGRFLWVLPHKMQWLETGRFERRPGALATLDDGDHWGEVVTVCRCGIGFMFRCCAPKTLEGFVVVRWGERAPDAAAKVGDALTVWKLAGTAGQSHPDGFYVHRLGRATASRVTD